MFGHVRYLPYLCSVKKKDKVEVKFKSIFSNSFICQYVKIMLNPKKAIVNPNKMLTFAPKL